MAKRPPRSWVWSATSVSCLWTNLPSPKCIVLIRLALGAGPDKIAQSVLWQGVGYATAGLLIGLPMAFALTRLMESVIFGITTHDPLTFTALPIAVVAAAVAACVLPARRAARVDPVMTMRAD